MNYITEWVTQIILFLLLALIIDLILPTSSLRKYIKLVVGLLLILIFLQPIFHLFEVDMDTFFAQEMSKWNDQAQVETMENLIEDKKKEIQASQRAYILEQMAVQLKKQAKEELLSEYGVEIQNFSFQFQDEQKMSLDTLKQLTVVLSESEKASNPSSSVEEVVIDLDQPPKEDEENSQAKQKIKTFLASTWQLPEEQLIIQWEGGVK
ncbi:stage III sporulation protein AF [Pontibacillus marinus]|uniref:Stage III sporulation protein AF n=1 Tax=Pontibacillus marinus BH030004 = DSM 16465 TaxID=1385511 RepID=A0A0A5GBE9_9BACI|nr:stage III sporulation protein AF [Pontibacillus marinus]KGX90486.1 stage III sporulation protein AF [Pontibacillus marinus BH030004 = DSM 16465]